MEKANFWDKVRGFHHEFVFSEKVKDNTEERLDISLQLPTSIYSKAKKEQHVSPDERKKKIIVFESNNSTAKQIWLEKCIEQDIQNLIKQDKTKLHGTILFSPNLQFSANITRLLRDTDIRVNLINSVSPYTASSAVKKINILNANIATTSEQLETLFDINTYQEKDALNYFLILLKMARANDSYNLSDLKNLIRDREHLTATYYNVQNHYVNVSNNKLKTYFGDIFGIKIDNDKSLEQCKKQVTKAMEWLHGLLMENNISDQHFEEKTGIAIRLQNRIQKTLINQQVKNLFIAAQSYQWLKANDLKNCLTVVTMPYHYENSHTTSILDNPVSSLIIANIFALLNKIQDEDNLFSIYFAGVDRYSMYDFFDKLKQYLSPNLLIMTAQSKDSLTIEERERQKFLIIKD